MLAAGLVARVVWLAQPLAAVFGCAKRIADTELLELWALSFKLTAQNPDAASG